MKVLLSFIGTNDAGKLLGKNDGAILSSLINEQFDKIILLWNETELGEIKFSDILINLKREIKRRKLVKKIEDNEFFFDDVTNHNEIYTKLKEFTDTLEKNNNTKYAAAISSGTPAMQVSWILLAESGDFSESNPLELIKVTDPKFSKSKNVKVKLNTTLPKIIGLKKEVTELKNDLIPQAIIDINKGKLTIGEKIVKLSPVEFCYYRYFAERIQKEDGMEKFSGFNVSINFIKRIHKFHEESFPDLDANRIDMEAMIKKDYELPIQTFRGHISKINKKLKKSLMNESLFKLFKITNEGTRGAKFYGLKLNKEKIIIT